MRSKNKENIIVLPNHDECPVGKTKDETKLLHLVSAEYGIEDDISYFNLQKQKNRYQLKLVFIPATVGDLHSDNAKKFVLFELIRNGLGSVVRVDEDLYKRAAAIHDLVNSNDPNAKETIRAKLSGILDGPGQLDHLVQLLLTDAQFNSFKYSVLNSKKTTSLLCVNTSGCFVRSLEAPFDVQDMLEWHEVRDVAIKHKKLVVHKPEGQITEITCLNKKTALAAHHHLRQYLEFIGTDIVPQPSSWFGRISQRIRKSFSRRSTSRLARPHHKQQQHQGSSGHSTDKPISCVTTQPLQSTAPSTIPESSFISEDVNDNAMSIVEPSLKTNSTYDVSLGSDNSYRPTITSLSNEELSESGGGGNDKTSSCQRTQQQLPHQPYNQQQQQQQQQQQNHQQWPSPGGQSNDDHSSMKTTSTYEISLDSRHQVRPMTSDNDSIGTGGHMSSFGAGSAPNRSSPAGKQVAFEEVVVTGATSGVGVSVSVPTAGTAGGGGGGDAAAAAVACATYTGTATGTVHTHDHTDTRHVTANIPSPSMVPPSPPVRSSLTTGTLGLSSITSSITCSMPSPLTHTDEDNTQSHMTHSIKLATPSPDVPPRTVTHSTTVATDVSSDKCMVMPPARTTSISPDATKKLTMTIGPIKEEELPVVTAPPVIGSTELDMSHLPLMSSQVHNHLADHDHVGATVPHILDTSVDPAPQDDLPNDCRSSTDVQHTSIVSDINDHDKYERPANLSLDDSTATSDSMLANKIESKLPVSRQRSIPSPKIPRATRIPSKGIPSPKEERISPGSSIPVKLAQSPSDKENYQNDKDNDENVTKDEDNCGERTSPNFSRFESQEVKVDSKTTFTSVTTVGDNIVKKSTQTEISSVKSTGIPTPKQYKSTTTITTTVKKPADISKSPSNSGTKIPTGIPRMASK